MIRLVCCILLITFFSCKKEGVSYVLLSGEAVALKLPYFIIKNKDITNIKTIDTLFLDENGVFEDTLLVKSGYYKIEAGKLNFDVYLEPGFNLKMFLDTRKSAVDYKGIGAAENKYVFQRLKKRQKLLKVDNYINFVKLDEQDFLKFNDSIMGVYDHLLVDANIKNLKFLQLEKNRIALIKAYNIMSFEIEKQILTNNKNYKVSANFPEPLDHIDINDEDLLKLPFFIPFLANNYYYFLTEKNNLYIKDNTLKCKDCDLDVAYLMQLDKVLKSEEIKNKASYLIAKWNIIDVDSLELFHKVFQDINTNPYFKKDIEATYNKLINVKKIRSVVNTKLIEKDGDTITLNQYNGKYMYIDIWASSCKPCLEEFPSFNQLAQKYATKKIVFIGINIWDSKQQWSGLLKQYKLKGTQFQLPEKNPSEVNFMEELEINSLPRYLLLDKYGDIIDFNAPYPSDSIVCHKLDSIFN